MEKQVKTSAGNETASQTVARIKAARANAESAAPAPTNNNALMSALTERLTKQGKGISSSASSNIQNSINEAISGVQKSGELTSASLQSERGREIGFAQDRASAKFTGAFESRTGFSTQTIALRELTETTEKSIRDLDGRYREAMMDNDANTASTVAGLRMEKLKFLQTQEENYFKNMITVAGIQQNQSQFDQEQGRLASNSKTEAEQFAKKMAQTDDQFTKNLGVQHQRLSLQKQELDISRQRNNISQQEFNLRKSELEKGQSATAITATIFTDLRNQVANGQQVSDIDATEYALWAFEEYAELYPNLEIEDVMFAANVAKTDMINNNLRPPTVEGTGFFADLMGSMSQQDSDSPLTPFQQAKERRRNGIRGIEGDGTIR
jgi:hypothetical protein